MFCQNCGKQNQPGSMFCEGCGSRLAAQAPVGPQQPMQQPVQPNPGMYNQPQPNPGIYNQGMNGGYNGQQGLNKGMAVLSYLSILCLIPYFGNKENDPYVKFHATQGINLFIISIVAQFIAGVVTRLIDIGILNLVLNLIPTLFYALELVGIIYAAQGKQKELPIVSSFKIIK